MRDIRNRLPGSAVVSFLALGLLWGASFVAIEVAVAGLPPLLLAGGRYAVAGLVVFGYAALTADRLLPRTRNELLVVGLAGLFTFGGYQAALFVGTQYVSGSVAAVIVSLSPVVAAAVGQAVLADESVSVLDGVGFLLGAVGVAVVTNPATGGVELFGVGVVLAGAVSFALGAVTTRAVDHTLPTATTQAWAMAAGSAVLLAGSVSSGESLPALASVSRRALFAFGYVALGSGAFGYLLYFRLLESTGATETTLVSYLEPVVAVGVAAVAVGDPISPTTVGGFLVVFAGFAVVKRGFLGRRVPTAWEAVWNRHA